MFIGAKSLKEKIDRLEAAIKLMEKDKILDFIIDKSYVRLSKMKKKLKNDTEAKDQAETDEC